METCPDCGANLALVGRVHKCRMANTPPVANNMANDVANTYKYRDAEKRRAYMREYMRKRRNEKIRHQEIS